MLQLTVCSQLGWPIIGSPSPSAPPAAAGEAASDPEGGDLGDEDADEDVRSIVVETGTRIGHALDDAPVEVVVIDRETIERSAADDVSELLEETPGLQVTRSFAGVGVRMQGLDERYTLILVDGERVTGRVGGVFDLRRLSTADIERVEIARGAASTQYGADAVAGVINIITRPPAEGVGGDLRLRAATRKSLDATGRLTLGWPKARFALSGGHHRSDGWRTDPSSIDTVGDDQRQSDGALRADLGDFKDHEVQLRSAYTRRDRLGVDIDSGGAVLDRQNRSDILQSSLALEGRRPTWSWRLGLGHSYWKDQYAVDQRGDVALDVYEVAKDHLGRVGLQFDTQLPQQLLSVGSEVQLESLQTPRLGEDSPFRTRGAVWVQDEWRPEVGAELQILPGIRLDYDSLFGLAFTPRVAMAVEPSDTLRLRASYGLGYRAPSFRELYLSFDNLSVGYVVRGNEQLQPERAFSFNADASWAPHRVVELHARVYDVQLRDLITTDLVSGGGGETQRFGYVNVGTAATRGLGAGTELRPIDRIRINLDYELLDARDLSNDRFLPGRARHSGQAAFSLRVGQEPWATDLSTRAAIFGPRIFGDPESEMGETTAPTFVSWDLQVRQSLGVGRGGGDRERPADGLELFMGIENLLGAGDAATNPMPPRTYFLGIGGRLGPRPFAHRPSSGSNPLTQHPSGLGDGAVPAL